MRSPTGSSISSLPAARSPISGLPSRALLLVALLVNPALIDGASEAKPARRPRAHLVIRLNGLTEASSVEAISERSSPAYAELVDILRETRFATVATSVRKFDDVDGLSSTASKCQSVVARSATMRETVCGKIYQNWR